MTKQTCPECRGSGVFERDPSGVFALDCPVCDGRGVLVIDHGDEILFTKWFDITPGGLAEWEPDPVGGDKADTRLDELA